MNHLRIVTGDTREPVRATSTSPVAFARRAFDRLKSGDLDAWSEGLCPERRVALQQAPARDEFRRTSLRIASKGATIASVKRIEGNGVTLNASELVSGRPRSASTRYSSFVVGIGDDLGRACVLGVSYY